MKNPPKLLNQLRALLGKQDARFKSSEQAFMIEEALYGHRNCLFTLPTGGGKSLIFQLPARIVQESSFYVVMVPLTELLKDHLRRIKDLGIEHSHWEPTLGFWDSLGVVRCTRGKFDFFHRPPFGLRFWQMVTGCIYNSGNYRPSL